MPVLDALIIARVAHFAAMIMLEGAILYRLLVLARVPASPQADKLRGAVRPWLVWTVWSSLAVGAVSGAAWLVLLAARIAAVPVGEAVSHGAALTVLTDTQFGTVWQIRSALMLVFALLALQRSGAPRVWRDAAAALVAAALLGSLAWAGHGASTPGAIGDVQLAGDVLHLVASGVWLGGLLPFAVTLAHARRQGAAGLARDATVRFSLLALASVVVLLGTGIVNTYVLAGSVPALLGTPYGRLLIVKVVLFATMICLAAVNRRRLTPELMTAGEAIGSASQVMKSLSRNSLIEWLLGLCIIAAVAVLGTMTPGLHDQPLWPLPFRIVFDAKTGILLGLLVLALAMVVVFALTSATSRWPIVVAAVAAIPFCVPVLLQSTQQAYPTTYWSSPTEYTAASILTGRQAFLANCSVCHGARGHGDGPAVPGLAVPPADLTADHVYAHLDGDMYWWIGNGIADVMPQFGAVLDEQARWSLIDFIHANADAGRLRAAEGRVTAIGYPVPRFSAECPDGSIVATDRLKGQALHIVFADGNVGAQRLEAEPKGVLPIVVAAHAGKLTRGCVARAPDALRLGRFFAPQTGQGTTTSEWLVDAQGLLRAQWSPGHGEPWTDPDVLRQRVGDLAQAADPVRGLVGSTHHH